jgi:uncharacterized membrane protein
MSEKNSTSLIYALVKDSLESQQTQKSTLETKASTLTGFAGGMIALLLGARETIISLHSTAKLLVIISIILFLCSILLATIVGWVRKYRTDPNPSSLAEHYLDKPEQDVKLQVLANQIGTWKNNSRQLEFNAVVLRIALLFQTVAFILLGIVVAWLLV